MAAQPPTQFTPSAIFFFSRFGFIALLIPRHARAGGDTHWYVSTEHPRISPQMTAVA